MRVIAICSLVFLASCSWLGEQSHNFNQWADCSLPTFSGERKDCQKNDAQAVPMQPPANYSTPPLPGQPTGAMPNMNAQQPRDDFPTEYQGVGKPKAPGMDDDNDPMIPQPPI